MLFPLPHHQHAKFRFGSQDQGRGAVLGISQPVFDPATAEDAFFAEIRQRLHVLFDLVGEERLRGFVRLALDALVDLVTARKRTEKE